MDFALVLLLGLVAGTVGGIVGFGTSIMLMPALVLVFGPREAVPIMAVVALMSNFAKITAWWRHIDWRASAAYALGGIPAAALGARTLLALPEDTNALILSRNGGATWQNPLAYPEYTFGSWGNAAVSPDGRVLAALNQFIALAKEKGVDMIHPGYGFLSENAEFAKACAEAGITFVGPGLDSLAAMGDKLRARAVARHRQRPLKIRISFAARAGPAPRRAPPAPRTARHSRRVASQTRS